MLFLNVLHLPGSRTLNKRRMPVKKNVSQAVEVARLIQVGACACGRVQYVEHLVTYSASEHLVVKSNVTQWWRETTSLAWSKTGS